MTIAPEILARYPFLRDVDPAAPTELLNGPNGRKLRAFNVRCRIPFTAPCVSDAQAITAGHLHAVRDALQDRAAAKPKKDGEPKGGGHTYDDLGDALVMGTASSTSVDFYGTEMCKAALDSMAEQMMRGEGMKVGIPYLPRHNHGLMGHLEWDEIIGRTIMAEVLPAEQVRAAYDAAEAQYTLRVTIRLFPEEPLAQAMMRRLARGEQIGQSIGGWFTQLQFMTDEEGEIVRVIVLGVELDHLAATRAPANPDSDDLMADLRGVVAQHLRSAAPVVRNAAPQAAPEVREAPNYGPAISEERSCGSCEYRDEAGTCTKYSFACEPLYVCDAWERAPSTIATAEDEHSRLQALEDAAARALGWLRQPAERHVLSVQLEGENEDVVVVRFAREKGEDAPAEDEPTEDEPEPDEESRSGEGGGEPEAPAPEPEPEPEGKVVDTHSQIEAACSLQVTEQDGRATISWASGTDAQVLRAAAVAIARGRYGDESKRAIRAVMPQLAAAADTGTDTDTNTDTDAGSSGDVDTLSAAKHDTSQSESDDARGSAPQPDPTPEQESTMPDNGPVITLDALAALLDSKLGPLAERVVQLESRGGAPAPSTPTPTPVDPVAAMEARAVAAEQRLAAVLSAPNRVGFAPGSTPHMPSGPVALDGLRGLIGRAKETGKATALSVISERSVEAITCQPGKAPANLKDHLTMLLDAAIADGLLTPPGISAGWN